MHRYTNTNELSITRVTDELNTLYSVHVKVFMLQVFTLFMWGLTFFTGNQTSFWFAVAGAIVSVFNFWLQYQINRWEAAYDRIRER